MPCQFPFRPRAPILSIPRRLLVAHWSSGMCLCPCLVRILEHEGCHGLCRSLVGECTLGQGLVNLRKVMDEFSVCLCFLCNMQVLVVFLSLWAPEDLARNLFGCCDCLVGHCYRGVFAHKHPLGWQFHSSVYSNCSWDVSFTSVLVVFLQFMVSTKVKDQCVFVGIFFWRGWHPVQESDRCNLLRMYQEIFWNSQRKFIEMTSRVPGKYGINMMLRNCEFSLFIPIQVPVGIAWNWLLPYLDMLSLFACFELVTSHNTISQPS